MSFYPNHHWADLLIIVYIDQQSELTRMSRISKKRITQILAPIGQVELHASVPDELRQTYMALNPMAEPASHWFSVEAVEMLLQIHPIHVIQTKKAYQCVAGLRSWQLAKQILAPEHEVPLILRPSPRQDGISRLAWADVYLGFLAFNLPDRLCQSGLAAFWNRVPKALLKQLTPGLKHASQFVRVFPGDRRKLSKSKKTGSQGE